MTSFSISPYPPAADAHAPTPPSYWAPEHHVSTSPLRLNNWLTPPIQLLALSTRASALSLSLAQLRAILRYREDAKMFASVRDMDANRRAHHASLLSPSTPPCCRHHVFSVALRGGVESIEDAAFWDMHWQAAQVEWPTFPAKSLWLQELLALEKALDASIADMGGAAFVKLSVRCPKVGCCSQMHLMIELRRRGPRQRSLGADCCRQDACVCLQRYKRIVEESMCACVS